MSHNGSGRAPVNLTGGFITLIAKLCFAIAATIIQRHAAVAPLTMVAVALLYGVVEVIFLQRRTIQRGLLRGIAVVIGGGTVANGGIRQHLV